ncbi:MAG TPA: glycine cleavage system aminomethyltransferase GcvT, partial [Rhodoglobus sp.]|nr:glycine cleavage system aminomethyltransferase GcvT [Rhodoglobus sp.]
MKQTALRDVHSALGATLVDFAGWEMPLRYGSESQEHRTVREAAGIFDLSHMGEIEVTGPQADQFLDFALVNRPSAISPGRARYSMICDESGGVIDDLVVYRLDLDRYMVVSNASNAREVLAELESRAAAFDVVVHDSLDEWALIAVQGPLSVKIVEMLVASPTEDLQYYAIRPDRIGEVEVFLARTGYTGEDGFEIYCAQDDAERVWTEAMAVGGPLGMVPVGLAARDSLRLEAGMPLYGNELS